MLAAIRAARGALQRPAARPRRLVRALSTEAPSPPPPPAGATAAARPSLPDDGLTLGDFVKRASTAASTSFEQPEASPSGRKVYIESYGCQMNTNDSEVVLSILKADGFTQTNDMREANLILVNTCAIRENAEHKVWHRLNYFRFIKRERRKTGPPIVGVLGCMAERLKTKLLESDKMVDIVVGPDAYRDLPRLVSHVEDGGVPVANTILSADETYADISPVRVDDGGVSAYVSIMRGCNNMCSFCIVPFTRGRERSRPMDSILDEIRALSDQLLEEASAIDPEMRIRFTSPHPKDFPGDLLDVIAARPNICKQLHIPAQSGSSAVLERMRRGYTREAYLELIAEVKAKLGTGACISSDFISGFCGETDEDHAQSVSLLEAVQYDQAFMFAYSMREKTHAHRNYVDDLPWEIKSARVNEMQLTFHAHAKLRNRALHGSIQLVLVEGPDRKYRDMLTGRTDGNKRTTFSGGRVPASTDLSAPLVELAPGDYAAVLIQDSTSSTLRGVAVARTGIREHAGTALPVWEALAAAAAARAGAGAYPPSSAAVSLEGDEAPPAAA
eukprot:tig00021521_g22088.t1